MQQNECIIFLRCFQMEKASAAVLQNVVTIRSKILSDLSRLTRLGKRQVLVDSGCEEKIFSAVIGRQNNSTSLL
jgi:hypothetical protein